uniref:Zinc finger protein CONSTANS-LIKe 4 protein n=1 Tax=Ambrosia artemisiifolia TaxID=4212 RepID=A0A4P8PNA1_AMBAR|nr:zinc finger protein CONSTANS-LIKe 4 protein [Ambrosia artemisiifolia]
MRNQALTIMSPTLCDSCKTTSASLFCKADSAYLCTRCDSNIHAANKLASRHERLWLCDVCEQAPASVTCKADAASLCVTCDNDIHSANPLARRHERFPVVPFTDVNININPVGTEADEAEAALWLLPNPNNIDKIVDGSGEDDMKVTESESDYLFNDIDLGMDLKGTDRKPNRYNSQTDGVVPVQNNKSDGDLQSYQVPLHTQVSEYVSAAAADVVEGLPAYDVAGFKPFMYNFTSQSISQSVSSSSLEIDVGVVPDHNAAMTDVSNNHHQSSTDVYPTPLVGFDREARVLRYREKKKNRKFEKTIRYASRKAYAETRPRIKGRFAKRTEMNVEADISPESSYGVVPSY